MEEEQKKTDIIATLFLICFCIMMLFGFNEELTENSAVYKNIIIPHINMNITIALAILSFSAIIACIILKKNKIDLITLLLIFRIPLYCIPIIYITGEFKIGVFYAIFQCVFSYYIGYNSKERFNSIVKILFLYSIAIAIEEFYVLFANNISIFSSNLKWYMVLPMGKSNYISCILLPVYVLVSRFHNDNKIFCFLYTMFIFLAILASGSKLALLLFIFYIIYQGFKKFISTKYFKKKKVLLGLLEFIIIILLIITLSSKYYNGFLSIIMKFTNNNIFENRLLVYKDIFNLILEHIFFGRSAYMYKAFDAVKAHNFILESLIQTGLIGTILFGIILVNVFKRIKNISDSKIKYAIIGFIIIYLIQGLAEPNLFGAASDAFFWVMIGIAISISNNSSNLTIK